MSYEDSRDQKALSEREIIHYREGYNMEHIPPIGWIVIGIGLFLLFIVLMTRGMRADVGGKSFEVGAGRLMDKKLAAFKSEQEKERHARISDKQRKEELFRRAAEIDENTKADELQVLRRIKEPIREVFMPYVKCNMPLLSVVELIKDVLQERIERNNMRKRLTTTERKGYVIDILYHIETGYKTFIMEVHAVPCNAERYPEWKRIEPLVEKIVNDWADEMVRIIGRRIKEKIDVYTAEKGSFLLDEYRQSCIDFPIKKNKGYLKALGLEEAYV